MVLGLCPRLHRIAWALVWVCGPKAWCQLGSERAAGWPSASRACHSAGGGGHRSGDGHAHGTRRTNRVEEDSCLGF